MTPEPNRYTELQDAEIRLVLATADQDPDERNRAYLARLHAEAPDLDAGMPHSPDDPASECLP